MIEFPMPELSQGSDQSAMMTISGVVAPGFLAKIVRLHGAIAHDHEQTCNGRHGDQANGSSEDEDHECHGHAGDAVVAERFAAGTASSSPGVDCAASSVPTGPSRVAGRMIPSERIHLPPSSGR